MDKSSKHYHSYTQNSEDSAADRGGTQLLLLTAFHVESGQDNSSKIFEPSGYSQILSVHLSPKQAEE